MPGTAVFSDGFVSLFLFVVALTIFGYLVSVQEMLGARSLLC